MIKAVTDDMLSETPDAATTAKTAETTAETPNTAIEVEFDPLHCETAEAETIELDDDLNGYDIAGSIGVGCLSDDSVGTDPVGTDPVGTDPVGTDPVGTDSVGTDSVGTDSVGTDPVGIGSADHSLTTGIGRQPLAAAIEAQRRDRLNDLSCQSLATADPLQANLAIINVDLMHLAHRMHQNVAELMTDRAGGPQDGQPFHGLRVYLGVVRQIDRFTHLQVKLQQKADGSESGAG